MIYNYIITNLINNKQYIGSHNHISSKKDSYLGSGKILLKAFKKYGRHNFKKDILNICDTIEESYKNEEKYIQEFNTLYPKGYNLSPTGGMQLFGKHSEITKQQLRKPKAKFSEEHKENLRKSHKGQIPWNKGKKLKPLSEEHKAKVSKSLKGKNTWSKNCKLSEEHKFKVRQHLFNRPVSEETRHKISESNKITKNKNKYVSL